MPLAPLFGHQTTRHDLARAVATSRLPQVLLFTGPRGIGKQRLGLWLAQLVLCKHPGDEPCGECASCTQVLNLAHPDLHWFIPVLRPKAGDADKQIDEVEETLGELIAERRKLPAWSPPDGMHSHGVAAARLMQRQASLMAVEGGWRVFLIGDAERLVPQESSQEAANALLKLLEEPPAKALFILTTSEPGQILPTIRSRTTPVRLGRLGDADVRSALEALNPAVSTDPVIAVAGGSVGAALGTGAGARSKAAVAATEFMAALSAGPTSAVERVLRQGSFQARGEFTDLLDALVVQLSSSAAIAAQNGGDVAKRNARGFIDGVDCVLQAKEKARGNVNPQLILAVLADELAAAGIA